MLWLLAQVWIWVVVAFLLGVLAGWLFWARPLRRRSVRCPRGCLARALHRATAG